MANPRVHEIAAELGVESKAVLAKLKELGEFVKSPSSSVMPPVARKVKAAFEAEGVKPESAEAGAKTKSDAAAKGKSGAAAQSQAKDAQPKGAQAKSGQSKAAKQTETAAGTADAGAKGAPKPGPKPAAGKDSAEADSGEPAAKAAGKLAAKPGARQGAKPGAAKPVAAKADAAKAEAAGSTAKDAKGGPRPGNNPFASVQGMGIPRPPRPGNNPFTRTQGMAKRPTPGNIPKPSKPQGAGKPDRAGKPGAPRPGAPRPGAPRPGGARPGGFSRPGAPGGGAGGGARPAPGGFAGRGRAGRGAGTAGAFGRGGSKSKARKSKRAKRQEFEMREAPVIGGVSVPRGTGDTVIRMRRGASLADFAEKIDTSASNLVTILFHLGEMATATESLDETTFEILGEELGYKIQIVSPEDEDKELLDSFDIDLEAEAADDENLLPRPPVVTVMGHVDHGKTRLLDAIRNANVVQGEAGGITQHIGAYQVTTPHEGEDRKITFIDTPGHEAFTAMRARGAQVTDIAILVVAADDGIMPQTVEALNHAKAANVPIVVAVNKVDKPEANPAKVRQQLTEFDLIAEEYGGDVMFVDVSAKNNMGIDNLLEAVLLTADAGLELQANPDRDARGVAIEAHLDKGRGAVATVLIQSGTLRVGDAIVTGTAYGRVRAMLDENGNSVTEAGPSRPVAVQGLSSVPRAGDSFIVTGEDRTARQIAEKREAAQRNAQLAKARKRMSLEDFTKALEEGKVESLNLIIKGDVSGAVEALEESLMKIEVDDSVQLRILHRGVGAITESDVDLATIDNAIIVGFNVRPDQKARERAQREGVDIRFYNVIYNAIDDIENSLKGLLKPEYEEVRSGVAEIREIFRSSKFGNIAGVIVRSGTITRNAKARVIRDGVVIADDLAIESLRRFKDDVTEVKTDYECGIGLGKYNDIREGDEIETTEMVEKPRV